MRAHLTDRVTADFAKAFGGRAAAVTASAPGRVNLIGEHTDYHEGFVLPAAINRRVAVACSPRADGVLRAFAAAYDEMVQTDLHELAPLGHGRWFDYVAGVAWAMTSSGHRLEGADMAIRSDLPIGSGLSSSAALEVAVARALAELGGVPWEPLPMAQLARQAENEFVGVRCGVMDQVVAAAGRAGCALLLDCRSVELTPITLPGDVAVLVMDTGVRRALGATPYDARRAACETAIRAIRTIEPSIRTLRDVDASLLEAGRSRMDAVAYRRARHVVSENRRPAALAEALRAGDLTRAGRLLDDSHASLRDLYEVSSVELDRTTDLARAAPGCFGARMTGAGFGGSAIALVDAPAVDRFVAQVQAGHRAHTARRGELFRCFPADGASIDQRS